MYLRYMYVNEIELKVTMMTDVSVITAIIVIIAIIIIVVVIVSYSCIVITIIFDNIVWVFVAIIVVKRFSGFS